MRLKDAGMLLGEPIGLNLLAGLGIIVAGMALVVGVRWQRLKKLLRISTA